MPSRGGLGLARRLDARHLCRIQARVDRAQPADVVEGEREIDVGREGLAGAAQRAGEAFAAEVELAFTFDDLGRLSAIDAGLEPAQVARIQTARLAEATA